MAKKHLEMAADMAESKYKKTKGSDKVEKVMHEYKEGDLHSGSPEGPEVKSRKQAIAIGLSEQRKKEGK